MSGQSFVQVPPDSTGKKMDTSVTSTAAQHRQVMTIGDSLTDANVAQVTAGQALKVDASATTQPVSASALPLPSGAATSANQPALGTAGTASTDVITVQGISSGTAQSVSGTVTVNAGTNTSTASLALETGGNLAAAKSDLDTIVTNTGNSATAANQTNGNQQVQGNVASGSSDSGNPLKVGGVGHTAAPSAVTDGHRVNFIADKVGKQVVVGSIRDLKGDASITLTASTSETTLVSQIASTFIDIYAIIVENTSATATEVAFRDTTGGTVRFNVYIPAGDTRGFILNESAAWNQATANTNWTAQCTTSVSSIKIAAMYVKNI